MEDLLIETLQEYGFPVLRQGSLAQSEPYPDSFFTFWNNATSGDSFYDNKPLATLWDFDVNFYSNNPITTYEKLGEAIKNLKSKGFIISGKGYDVASDEITHTGRGTNALFVEKN